jgi:hypothetical protein
MLHQHLHLVLHHHHRHPAHRHAIAASSASSLPDRSAANPPGPTYHSAGPCRAIWSRGPWVGRAAANDAPCDAAQDDRVQANTSNSRRPVGRISASRRPPARGSEQRRCCPPARYARMEQQDCETRECETAALVRGCNLPVQSLYRNPLPAVSLRRRVAVHPPQTSQTLLHAHFTSPFSRPRCICRAPSCRRRRRRRRRHVAPMAPWPSESTRPQHRAPAGIEQDASCATTLPRPRHHTTRALPRPAHLVTSPLVL